MINAAVPFVPKRVGLPEWKKYWVDRGFARELKEQGVLSNDPPDVINRIFQTGPYFTLVTDYRYLTFDYIAGVKMLGFTKEEFEEGKLDFLISLVHPEEVEKVLGLAVHYFNFLASQPVEIRTSFKGSLNLRLRNAKGEYVRFLEQAIALRLDEEGRVIHLLKCFTDISHLKYSEEVVLSILDDRDSNNQQFYTFNVENHSVPVLNEQNIAFSAREKEVLSLIAMGKTSKEIAMKLNISVYTVNKHRENMMRKTFSKNISEVINFAHCNDCL